MNLKGVLFFMIGAIFKMPFFSFKPGLKVLFPRDLKVSRVSKLKHCIPMGKEDIQRIRNQKCIRHLVLPTQSAKSQTTQAPSDITEESGMACCRTTSRVQHRNRLGWECLSRSKLSGFLAEFRLASYLGDEGACVALHFLAEEEFTVRERRATGSTYDALTALLGALM